MRFSRARESPSTIENHAIRYYPHEKRILSLHQLDREPVADQRSSEHGTASFNLM
jgi:hypothetical protein